MRPGIALAWLALVAGCASPQPSPRFAVSAEPLPSIAVSTGASPGGRGNDPAIELERIAERFTRRAGELSTEMVAILDGTEPLADERVRQRLERLAQDAFRRVEASRRTIERTPSLPCTEAAWQDHEAYVGAVETLGGAAVGLSFEPDNPDSVTAARAAAAQVDQLGIELEAAIAAIECP